MRKLTLLLLGHAVGLYPDGRRYRQTSYSDRQPYHSSVLTPSAGTQFQGEPLQQGHKIHGSGKILRFSTAFAVYLGNGTR